MLIVFQILVSYVFFYLLGKHVICVFAQAWSFFEHVSLSVSEFNSDFLKFKAADENSNTTKLTCCYLHRSFLLHLWYSYDMNDFLEILVSLCLLRSHLEKVLLWNPANKGTWMLLLFPSEIYCFNSKFVWAGLLTGITLILTYSHIIFFWRLTS